MTQLPRRKIESGLLRKGFKKEYTDHRVFRFYVNNKKTSISTFVSHGSGYKDYSDDLILKMKRELCMPNKRNIQEIWYQWGKLKIVRFYNTVS